MDTINTSKPNESADDIDVLQDKIKELEQQNQEYLDNWKRERADFTNYKNDEIKRISEVVSYTGDRFLIDLLDVRDRFDVAQSSATDLIKSSDWYQGLIQAIRGLDEFLRKNEIERIETDGKSFDPLLHEAVEVRDKDGQKIEEIRAGYKRGSRVIRPARVRLIK